MSQNAIIARNASKCYKKGQAAVLDNLNMTVPHGCIYALLGASGCGKTTILSCIVGMKKLDQGSICVLGGKPGEKKSGIPGPRVGYMPQDNSLVQEFSTIDALYYFGRINGIDDSVVDEKYKFFMDLLSLPSRNCLVKNMSGGQQRRVSLVASLLHDPELLVLDEPTVGQDSLLREKIWDFLMTITKEIGTTVVITTHYIEEAKFADRIALMRYGKLLAETTTDKLLTKFRCSTLEEVFWILSQKQEDNRTSKIQEIDNDLIDDNPEQTIPIKGDSQNDNDEQTEYDIIKKRHTRKIFKALMIKNLLQFIRHPGTILFAIILPMIQTIVFNYGVGGDPRDLIVAIVNDEAGHCNYGKNLGSVIYNSTDGTCNYLNVSCRFLDGLKEPFVEKRYFDTLKEATNAVKHGKATSLLYFSLNFSRALQSRFNDPTILSEADIKAGEIHAKLDMSNQVVGLFLQRELLERYLQIHGDIVAECNLTRKLTEIPVRFEQPIFGKQHQSYTVFMTSGFILTITFFLATAVSSSVIVSDKAEGVWDRSLVQGVSTTEILCSHFLTQMLLMFIQVATLNCMTFLYFQIPCNGNFAIVIAISILDGICGLCYGFTISVLLANYTLVNFLLNGSLFTSMILSGIIWPLEGMPTFLRYLSFFLPTTIPGLSLRSVLEKGFSIVDPDVYNGFLVLFGWTFIFFICCILGIRNKAT